MINNVPVIAFFGSKGGVGKTTITNKFADLITCAKDKPKVMLIDFDVSARGTTIYRTKGTAFTCKTLHDYIANRAINVEEVIDVSETIDVRGTKSIKQDNLYLIPSATKDAKKTFDAMAQIRPDELLKVIEALIESSIIKYKASCILIDCGPTLNDPYTAAAAQIADTAFLVAQNEPTSQEAFSNYTEKIKEFYPNFNSQKMKIVLNKVRAAVPDSHQWDTVIPFTMDIVDITEGIKDVDDIRLTLLDYYILEMIKRNLNRNYPQLVPEYDVILSDSWKKVLEKAPELAKSFRVKLYKISKWVIVPFGLMAVITVFLLKKLVEIDHFFGLFNIYFMLLPALALIGIGLWGWLNYREHIFYLMKLIEKKDEFLFSELRKRKGRRILEGIKDWLN